MTSPTRLREISKSDLLVFFTQQLDPEANHMAAFTAKDPGDRSAFDAHWKKILADETTTLRTILYGDAVAGYIVSHGWFGEPEISYWIGRQYWGRGIATAALTAFLNQYLIRPLHARVAKDNQASIRVLEKCGFMQSGEDKGFSNARGEEIEELILILA